MKCTAHGTGNQDCSTTSTKARKAAQTQSAINLFLREEEGWYFYNGALLTKARTPFAGYMVKSRTRLIYCRWLLVSVAA